MPCLDTIRMGYGNPYDHDFKWGVDRETQVKHLYGTFKIVDAWSTSGDPAYVPPLFRNVEYMLQDLHGRGHELAIVTSKPSAPLAATLKHYKLDHYFCAIRTSCDVKGRGEAEKPAPDQLLSIMRDRKATPEVTVMIGDTVMDIKMGCGAGATAVGVTWGVHPRQHLLDAGAHHICDTHAGDLVRYI
jgi:phosphoglycolate phosphatase